MMTHEKVNNLKICSLGLFSDAVLECAVDGNFRTTLVGVAGVILKLHYISLFTC